MHRSNVKEMSRNRTELDTKCSHAAVGRGLGCVRCAAECSPLTGSRPRAIDPERDHHLRRGPRQRRIITRRLTHPFWVKPGLRHWLIAPALGAVSGLIPQHAEPGWMYSSFYPHELTPGDLLPSLNNVTVLR